MVLNPFTCSVQSSGLRLLQGLVADEHGAQQPVQRRGDAPLGVLQARLDGVHRGVAQGAPATCSEGGRERLRADE